MTYIAASSPIGSLERAMHGEEANPTVALVLWVQELYNFNHQLLYPTSASIIIVLCACYL